MCNMDIKGQKYFCVGVYFWIVIGYFLYENGLLKFTGIKKGVVIADKT